eukprot:5254630-Pleurochrysis_carterae.AAC.1
MEMRALSLPSTRLGSQNFDHVLSLPLLGDDENCFLCRSCKPAAGWWGLSAAAERAHPSATLERSWQNVHGAAARTDSGDVGTMNRKPPTCGDMVHARHTKVTSRARACVQEPDVAEA